MRSFFLFAGVICLLSGCTGGGGGSTVTGKVTLDDGSPAPRGTVMLRSEAGSFRGAIESDGTYTIENVADGNYTVAVTGVMDKEASGDGMVWDEAKGDYVEPEGGAPKSLIKSDYSIFEKSGLTLTVPGSGDLTLERSGQAAAPASEAPPKPPAGDDSPE